MVFSFPRLLGGLVLVLFCTVKCQGWRDCDMHQACLFSAPLPQGAGLFHMPAHMGSQGEGLTPLHRVRPPRMLHHMGEMKRGSEPFREMGCPRSYYTDTGAQTPSKEQTPQILAHTWGQAEGFSPSQRCKVPPDPGSSRKGEWVQIPQEGSCPPSKSQLI